MWAGGLSVNLLSQYKWLHLLDLWIQLTPIQTHTLRSLECGTQASISTPHSMIQYLTIAIIKINSLNCLMVHREISQSTKCKHTLTFTSISRSRSQGIRGLVDCISLPFILCVQIDRLLFIWQTFLAFQPPPMKTTERNLHWNSFPNSHQLTPLHVCLICCIIVRWRLSFGFLNQLKSFDTLTHWIER